MDSKEVEKIIEHLNQAYEEECRNRPPCLPAIILIASVIAWVIGIIIVVCNRVEHN